MARRFTASVVKTRPKRDNADFFMRAFDDTNEQTTRYEGWGIWTSERQRAEQPG